jgi:hypothetical protein
MIRKTLLSAGVFFWLYCSLFNPILAQTTTNPFNGSQYSDLTDLADWYIAQGGSIDDYFYSEGFTTGSDGQLGNENICIRDDVNKVYVGRSDVCFDRAMDGDGYSYLWVDKQDWSLGYPQDIALETGDLIGDGAINWSGCFNVYPDGEQIWAGTSDGQCPNMHENGGQINYGYVQQTLTNTAAINLALQEAGVEVTGYRYEWNVKNADANMETENNPDSVDPFEVTIKIYNSTGQTVFEKTYDYSYWIDNWTTFSGEETFASPFDADTLSEVQLSITGYDIGFWAGYYGPEFSSPEVNLQYRMKAVPMDSCDDIPVIDPTCPGFIGNMPEEDTKPKELVIIESTGSIPLSEDELAVLESLDEQQEQVIETIEAEQQEQQTVDNSAALAIAQNAEANAISEAEATIDNTLAATAIISQELTQQSFSINQSSTQQANQSMQQAESTQQQSSQSSIEQGSIDMGDGISLDGNIAVSNLTMQTQSMEQDDTAVDVTVDTFEIAALENVIETAIMDLLNREKQLVREQTNADEQKEELVEQLSNDEEDELVEAALQGDDSEEAQAALLGFNPNFRAYQQPQMTDADFYEPKEIYEGQKNHDNPNARFFNGASDSLHNEMVRQQYER